MAAMFWVRWAVTAVSCMAAAMGSKNQRRRLLVVGCWLLVELGSVAGCWLVLGWVRRVRIAARIT